MVSVQLLEALYHAIRDVLVIVDVLDIVVCYTVLHGSPDTFLNTWAGTFFARIVSSLRQRQNRSKKTRTSPYNKTKGSTKNHSELAN